jgi:hypothetical protein
MLAHHVLTLNKLAAQAVEIAPMIAEHRRQSLSTVPPALQNMVPLAPLDAPPATAFPTITVS